MSKLDETAMSQARAALSIQDKQRPFLINRKNGRLLPNVARLRTHPDMQPYTGNVRASLEERMRYLRTGTFRQVVDTSVTDETPFDVGTATKDELIAFAFNELGGLQLDPKTPLPGMRKQVVKAANALSAGNTPEGNGGESGTEELG